MSFIALLKNCFVYLVLIIYYILESIVLFFIPHSVRYKDIKGETVLITGAGSGIGRGLSVKFAELGCKLVLWDINGESIRETKQMVQKYDVGCWEYVVDLTNREQVYEVAKLVIKDVGDVDILVNNAGIVTGKDFFYCPDNLIEKTMDVNINAHFWTVKSFLPSMVARNHGHVVTIASGAGLFGVKGLVDYCASKFAAVGFHESLMLEIDGLDISDVHFTVVCPYFIDTGMFEGVKSFLLFPILKTHQVLDSIIDGVLVNKSMVLLPPILSILLVLKAILPTKCFLLLAKFMKSHEAMNEFKGRQ